MNERYIVHRKISESPACVKWKHFNTLCTVAIISNFHKFDKIATNMTPYLTLYQIKLTLSSKVKIHVRYDLVLIACRNVHISHLI